MSAYREFTGKTVEEALRLAREAFGAGLDDLDFEILTPGSRGVLGMGAEPARILAAPRSELGGAAPKRDAAAARPLPSPAREDHGDRPRPDQSRDRGPRRDDRGDRPSSDDRRPQREPGPVEAAAPPPPRGAQGERGERGDRPRSDDRGPRRDDRGGRPRTGDRGPRRDDRPDRAPHRGPELTDHEAAEVNALRGSVAAERAELEAAEASPEALAAGKVILVDVEDYRGRRERQLREIADRAAQRVIETGKMLQLEPMPALERRWVHLALRNHPDVATQSIGEEPNRRIIVLPRAG